MNTPSGVPDHYAVLGLTLEADADDIRAAYRTAAKAAHPDAGGSAAAMTAVNEAHRVLADPALRRAYDQELHPPEPVPEAAAPHAAPPGTPPAHHDARAFHRSRLGQARRNALHILRRAAVASFLATVITRYFLTFAPDTASRVMLKLIGFVPVYAFLLGLVFFLSPQIRLDLHDLVMHLRRRGPDPRLTSTEKITLVALGATFVPLAVIWAIFT